MRALIADELASMRHFLVMCLAEFPELDFDQAADVEETLGHLAQRPYDLFLLDLALPEPDCLPVLRAVRDKDGSGRPTPVVVMTSQTSPGADCQLQELRAQVLSKPVKAEELRQLVQRLLELPARPERQVSEPPRVSARFDDEKEEREYPTAELNALGAFLCTDTPAKIGRSGVVHLRFPHGPELRVDARVVHVRAPAVAAGLPPGFAVQFSPATPALSAQLARAFSPPAAEDVDELRMVAKLRRMPIFRELVASELELLKTIVHEVPCATEEEVIREGDPSNAFYLIKSGAVKIVKGQPAQELAVLREGDFFGEMGVLLQAPRSASVVAIQPSELYRIAGSDLFALLRGHPEMMQKVRATMIDRYAQNVDTVLAEA